MKIKDVWQGMSCYDHMGNKHFHKKTATEMCRGFGK